MWKWIAALFATILLAGAPGIVYALRSPSPESIDVIRERQQQVLQRLAVLDVQIAQLQAEVAQLQLDLDQHEQATQTP